jgi:hypothetical protein
MAPELGLSSRSLNEQASDLVRRLDARGASHPGRQLMRTRNDVVALSLARSPVVEHPSLQGPRANSESVGTESLPRSGARPSSTYG